MRAAFGHLPRRDDLFAERRAERQRDKDVHKRQLARLLVSPPDEYLHDVEQQQNDHRAGAPVMQRADEGPQRHLFLDELDARPGAVQGRRIVHRQQDPGDHLQHENEKEEAAEGGGPA